MEAARNGDRRCISQIAGGSARGSMVEQRHGSCLESSSSSLSLATQLQQAWLQTKLPKLPKRDGARAELPAADACYQFRAFADGFQQEQQQEQQPAPALSRSSSRSQRSSPNSILAHAALQYASPPWAVVSEGGSADTSGGGGEDVELGGAGGESSESMGDDDIIMLLQHLSDVLMDEQMADRKRAYVPCSAYQAVTKGLADLLGDEGRAADGNSYGEASGAGAPPAANHFEAPDTAVNSWIDEVLNLNPNDFLYEDQSGEPYGGESSRDDAVSSVATGISSIETGSPGPRSSASTSEEATSAAAPAIERLNEIYDCLYVENDGPENAIVDYANGRSGVESLVDLYPLLMQCAQAVATNNLSEADELIHHLYQKTSPFGDGGQRIGFYVVEALVARLSGTGAQLYTALSSSRPSATEMLKAYRMFVKYNPLAKISHFFANATILKAVQDSDRIHIIDYGILYGVQWPSLLKKLSTREGGPPHVRITGIDFAQTGFQKNYRVEDTGRWLQKKAKEVGVELEFHAIAGKWENITAAQLQLRDDETLIVNCMFRLRNLLDETVMASNPRKAVLSRIRSLNPKVFAMGVINGGYNSPFFMARFRDTIGHFSAVFDSIHTTVPPDAEMRLLVEKEILGLEILNVIACEGTERIERAETYRQWQSRSSNAGLKQLPVDAGIVARAQDFLKSFNRNYGIALDKNWLLSGWRDRVLLGFSAWTCA